MEARGLQNGAKMESRGCLGIGSAQSLPKGATRKPQERILESSRRPKGAQRSRASAAGDPNAANLAGRGGQGDARRGQGSARGGTRVAKGCWTLHRTLGLCREPGTGYSPPGGTPKTVD